MERCEGCSQEREDVVDGLCSTCRGELGIAVASLPVQRPAVPCQRCGGLEIIQALLRERGASTGRYVYSFLRPLAVSHGVNEERTFWTDRKTGVTANLGVYFGALVAYVCRACGHTELYTVAPEEIPIGSVHGTRLLRYETTPYR